MSMINKCQLNEWMTYISDKKKNLSKCCSLDRWISLASRKNRLPGGSVCNCHI